MTTAAPSSPEGPLAMICGGGTLPLAVADYVAARGRQVVLFPLYGAANAAGLDRYQHHWVHVGQIGKFMRLARAAGCRDVVLIGALIRPSLWHTHPDLKALSLLPRVLAAFRGGDNHLLTGMSRLLEHDGFHLRGAHEVAPEILVPEGVLGGVAPSDRDRADIALGLDYLKAAGSFDIGQAAVIAGRHILAVEGIEGTDQMLERVAQLRANGRIRAAAGTGVLVKAPKPNQDRRFDLPSIGPQTVDYVARAGLAGIAVVGGATIMAEPNKLAQAADRAKVFVIGMSPDAVP